VYLNQEILKLDFIDNVEVFKGEYAKNYSFMVLTRNILSILFIVILISSFFMLLQQLKLLFFEYNERITILQLLGASITHSTRIIIKFIVESVVISIITISIFISIIVLNLPLVIESDILLTLLPTLGDMTLDIVMIVSLAIIIPAIAYGALILKYRNSDNV
jgi:ABC-type lipoprotein release transport system permease subunit